VEAGRSKVYAKHTLHPVSDGEVLLVASERLVSSLAEMADQVIDLATVKRDKPPILAKVAALREFVGHGGKLNVLSLPAPANVNSKTSSAILVELGV
jgi:hypothetical protein